MKKDLSKVKLKDIYSFIIGNYRYSLYYSKFAFLIRPYIREQIKARINSMDRLCYKAGECKICGCKTTALQMSNKACDKPCYPKMMSKKTWKCFKKGYPAYDTKNEVFWCYDATNNKIKSQNDCYGY